jgi:hypothetical protein
MQLGVSTIQLDMPRTDTFFLDNISIAFIMYCDENNMSLEEGQELAEKLNDAISGAADDRINYLP